MYNFLKLIADIAEQLTKSILVLLAFLGLLFLSLGLFLISRTSISDILSITFMLIGIVMLLVLLFVSNGGYGRIAILPNIAAVSDAIKQASSTISAGDIYQTYVGTNLVAGRKDFIHKLLGRVEGHMVINRYFFVNSAFDINFAAHSVAIAENLQQKSPLLRNYIWTGSDTGILADIFLNLTIFPDQVIISMSSRDDQKHGSAKIVKDSDSKDVIGIAIGSKKIVNFVTAYYCERLTRANTNSLSEVTAKMYELDSDLFFSAAVHSVVKEWCADEQFQLEKETGARIHCAALVGSYARRLNRRKDQPFSEGIEDSTQCDNTIQDIDLLVFVRDLKQTDVDALVNIAQEVLGRFKAPNKMLFSVETEMAPVVSSRSVITNGSTVVLHLIINDATLAHSRAPSPLVASHRIEESLMIKGVDMDLKKSYRTPGPPTPEMLLTKELGVRDLREQLETKSMKVRYWNEDNMEEREHRMEDAQYSAFAKYAVKWISVNLRRVLNRPSDPDQWLTYWHLHRHCIGIDKTDFTPDTAIYFAREVEGLLHPDSDLQGRLANYRSRLDETERHKY